MSVFLIEKIHNFIEYSDGRAVVELICARGAKSKVVSEFKSLYPLVNVLKTNSLVTTDNKKKFFIKISEAVSFKKYIE